MKCTYTSKNGQLTFEFDANGPKDLFLQRATVEMHDEEQCGMCGCKDIRCEVRKNGDYTFYEMRCQKRECGARLEFGQNKDMVNLFVKRSEHPDTNGWFIYTGGDREQDDTPAPPQAPSDRNQRPAPAPQNNGSKFPAPAPQQTPRAPAKPAGSPAATNGTAGPTTPIPSRQTAQIPKAANGQAPARPMTIDEKHREALRGYRDAKDEAALLTVTDWAAHQDFQQHHWDEQADERAKAMDRIVGIPF